MFLLSFSFFIHCIPHDIPININPINPVFPVSKCSSSFIDMCVYIEERVSFSKQSSFSMVRSDVSISKCSLAGIKTCLLFIRIVAACYFTAKIL